jgi:hypothetical protein
MYPPEGAGGAGFATLRRYMPGRALGFGTRVVGTPLTAPEDGSWTFVVQPLDGYTTRLLIRGRGPVTRSWLGLAFDRSVFEPVHFVMERRMMVGIKQLAEGQDRRRVINRLQVALWTMDIRAVHRVRRAGLAPERMAAAAGRIRGGGSGLSGADAGSATDHPGLDTGRRSRRHSLVARRLGNFPPAREIFRASRCGRPPRCRKLRTTLRSFAVPGRGTLVEILSAGDQ